MFFFHAEYGTPYAHEGLEFRRVLFRSAGRPTRRSRARRSWRRSAASRIRALPEALFQSTNRNFVSGYNGNILHDWIIYDPRELVNLVDQYAAEEIGRAA